MQILFNAIGPFLLLIVLGGLLRRLGLLKTELCEPLNRLTYEVFLPASIFVSIYGSKKTNAEGIRLSIFILIATVVAFAVSFWLVACMKLPLTQKGVLIQGMFRGNPAIYISLMGVLHGADNAGVLGEQMILIVPLYSTLAVIALLSCTGKQIDLQSILKSLGKNVLIIAAIIALAIRRVGISLPEILLIPLRNLSAMAAPLAFLTLSASLQIRTIRNHWKALLIGIGGKLLLLPFAVLIIADRLEFDTVQMTAIALVFATPTASSSYPMACVMGGDADLAGELVAVSSAIGLISLFGWLYCFTF